MNHLDERIYNLLDKIRALLKDILDTELLTEYPIFYQKYTVIMDAVIRKSSVLLAVFEMKPYKKRIGLTDFRNIPTAEKPIAKYTILTNGVQILVRDHFAKTITQFESPELLVNQILKLLSPEQIEMKRREIAQIMHQESQAFFNDNPGESWKNNMQDQLRFQRLFDELHYDRNGQFFRLGTDITMEENFENQLFNILLEDVKQDQKIYRYAALETMFVTIKHQSIRMNGIAGMNDPSELDYADMYFNQEFNIFSDKNELMAANKRFITCCSQLEDNLNQWRLYGDDCRGACFVFRLKPNRYLPGIRVKKISYGKKQSNGGYHPELELVKRLLDAVRHSTDQSLQLKSLGVWKHFFKPFEYAEEKEVRVLMVLNNRNYIKGSTQILEKQWNLTNSHNIIAPYIQIPLHDEVLPISLDSVILGSKCPEKALNLAQLEIILAEIGLGYIKVNQSQIQNYR